MRADMPEAHFFAAHEVARWPKGAMDWLTGARILREAEPGEETLCEECDRGCQIKPIIHKDPRTGQRVGRCFCEQNEVGPFNVNLNRLRQWVFSLGGLAKMVSKAVKPTGKVIELVPERLALLGIVKLDGKNRELFLARGAAWPDSKGIVGNAARLRAAIHPVILTLAAMPPQDLLPGTTFAARPLAEIATFGNGELLITIEGAIPATEPWSKAPNTQPADVESPDGYDPDAYMPVKELREKMDPPWDFGKWTKIKTANPWIRFDPKASKQHPRIHRADAARLEKGKLEPDTFELLDVQGDDLPGIDQLTDEYLADAAARKAEIKAEKTRRRGV
jgi:hypothetical protein